MNEQQGLNARRLPIYLLLDCSGSMTGEPIEAVRQGIRALVSDMREDPQALESVHLSVITFGSVARQAVPLTDLMSFVEPEISAGGATALGAALKLLVSCMKTELRRPTPAQKGDWRSIVFVITDGVPTDENEVRAAIPELHALKPADIIVCAAGPAADRTLLRQITDHVLEMKDITPGQMASFFAWLSASVKDKSRGLCDVPCPASAMPPLPQGVRTIP